MKNDTSKLTRVEIQRYKNTLDTLKVNIETPGGSVSYDIKTLKVKQYTLDEIFEKKLLFLIPFYIFTYEEELKNIDDNKDKISKLIDEYNEIVEHLEKLNKTSKLDTYEMLMIKAVTKIVVRESCKKI